MAMLSVLCTVVFAPQGRPCHLFLSEAESVSEPVLPEWLHELKASETSPGTEPATYQPVAHSLKPNVLPVSHSFTVI